MTKEQLFIQLVNTLSSKKLYFGHAVVDAEDEAMMVLMHVLKQSVDEILSTGNAIVSEIEISISENIVIERINKLEPMAYVIGKVSFCGLSFYSDSRALVPRSPIAELIQDAFSQWLDIFKVRTALDLCTGSGCIGLSMSHYFKHLSVDISDLSHQALELAEKNMNLLGLNKSITIIESDLFQNINQKYDLIVTNPPYVSDAEYSQLPQEYKKEPKLGLVTHKQGLEIPVQILYQASDYLTDNGMLFLEVGYSDALLDEAFPTINIEWIDFLNGGQGVCVFNRKMLLEYRTYFKAFLENKDVI
ncbi:MAG: 50S ribosomal protein L3 N(5)-glutamine methyltransferase [Marinicellaceae bacterium]